MDEYKESSVNDVEFEERLSRAIVNLPMLQWLCWFIAHSNGFHDVREIEGVERDASVGERLALIHSEISEALDAYRKHGLEEWVEADGKPEGFSVELADAIVRILDLAEVLELSITNALYHKMLYNRTRPYMHGNEGAQL